jgi:hypothetical protein
MTKSSGYLVPIRTRSRPGTEYDAGPYNQYGGVWSAARDTFRTLFLAPPPDVRAAFEQPVEAF